MSERLSLRLPASALRKTKNSGLQPALDYLQEHEDSDGADSGNEQDDAMDTVGDGAKVPEIVGEAKVNDHPATDRLFERCIRVHSTCSLQKLSNPDALSSC